MTVSSNNLSAPGANIPYTSPDDFLSSIPPDKPLAGLDLGTKTIGLAISDSNLMIATPLETIFRTKFKNDIAKLQTLEAYWKPGGYVLGLPRNMDGSEGPRCQSVRSFARNLCQFTTLPITFWDERLSTVSAEKYLLETGASRKKRNEKKDNFAASIILQNALDYFNHQRLRK